MKFYFKPIIFIFALLVLGGFGFGVNAATLNWVGSTDGANTNVATNWSTTPDACTASGNGTIPTNADTLIFTSSCVNGATFNASITARSGRISIQSGYTGTIKGNNSITYANPVILQDNVTVFVDTGNTFTLSGIIGDGGGVKGIFKTGAGTLTLQGVNTFTGGLTIKAGTVLGQTSVNAFGANSSVITLGDSSGSANATLNAGNSLSFANPITVASGNSGTLTVSAGNSTSTFSGGITLYKDVTLAALTNGTFTESGGISGTGNITLSSSGSSPGGIVTISSNSVNNTGTITNSGSGSGTTTISAAVGANVTQIIQASSTSPLVVSGAITTTSGIEKVFTSTGTSLFTISNAVTGITGTGNVTFNANSSGNFTVSATPINNSGTVTNSGTSTGVTTISGVISTNVTGVIQNSATSQLTLTGVNTFTGGLYVAKGTVVGTTSANAFGSTAGGGTNGSITLGCKTADTSGGLACGTATAKLTGWYSGTIDNPITIASGSSGIKTITNYIPGSSGAAIFSGAITLYDNLTINPAGSSQIVLSGGITGSGNIIINNDAGGGTLLSGVGGHINNSGTITNSGGGSGTTTISGIIDTAVTGVIQNSATSQLILSGVNTFTSGLTIKSGTVAARTSSQALGDVTGGGTNGTVTIGDTSGSASATLLFDTTSSMAPANPITIASGSSGTLGISALTSGGVISFGPITLNNNLTLTANRTLTIDHGITGTGNVIINNTGASLGANISTTSINITGTITNSSGGSLAATISSVIGTNVTGVIQNSATSQLTLSGTNTFTSGLYIMNGTVAANANAALGASSAADSVTLGCKSADSAICGSANATIKNPYNSISNPITVASGSSGTLSINGTSTGAPTFSGLITLNNNLTVGNLVTGAYNLAFNGGVIGTGNIIVNNTSTSTTSFTTSVNGVNNTGTITNSGTGSGITTISAVIGTNVTGVIQNSATSPLTLSGANTFTSGLTIKSGTVQGQTNANAFGANSSVITIGDTSGTANANLYAYFTAGTTVANPITVASGSASNTLSLVSVNYSRTTFSGAITLNNNLTLTLGSSDTWSYLTLTGGITGTGNITLNNTNGSAGGVITLSGTTINHTGSITNSGSGIGPTTISAVIGSNVTGIVQNSSTSKLLLSGNNSNTGNVTITSGTLELSGTTNLNVGGNWSKATAGTFTPNSGTVTFNNSALTSTISGNNTFYNLTCITPSKSITFTKSSTTTVTHTLNLNGQASGTKIVLRSTATKTKWNINTTGTTGNTLSYLDIKDSSSTLALSPTNSTDSGGNINWFAAWLSGWIYRKKITISNTNVGSDLSYFPVLVKLLPVQNIIQKSRNDGFDLRFTSSDGSTLLPYEREKFTPAEANIWVQVPTITTATSTDIYVYYGNSSSSTDWTSATSTITNCTTITNAQCVWKEGASQNYKGVWHLKETGTNPTVNDSTSNANNSTSQTWTPTTSGKIGNAGSFNGTSSIMTMPSITSTGDFTFSAWVNLSTRYGSYYSIFLVNGSPYRQLYIANTTYNLHFYSVGSGDYDSGITVPLNEWTKIGVTLSGTTLTFYKNNLSTSVTKTVAGATGVLNIGYFSSNYFSGILDEPRISSTARSADWAKFEYYNMNSASNELTIASAQETTASQTATIKGKLRVKAKLRIK